MKSKLVNVFGAITVAIALVVGTTMIVHPAVSELAGLAVAQTASLWNNVADASKGDALTSGIVAGAPYLYNGLTFDRLRSVPAADGTAGTGYLGAVVEVFNGTTYDRMRGGLAADASAVTGITSTQPMLYNGATYDRWRGSVANGALVEKKTVGTAFYSVKRDNITTASVNLAFGLTSRKIMIVVPSGNTDDVCVDWIGGTAVCPAANTAGDGRLAPGTSLVMDDYAVTSLSVIAASGTQIVSIYAWN